ncbi:DNA cytosine methyltransferase [Labrys neptuniae]
MTAYYNDNEPDAAHVLDCLQREGLIAPGIVDHRSIKEVQPDDLKGFTQCHFFAGAGLWSVAARLAGWPDERPIWTGSCPCQPFSAAGKGLGTDDPRHLWPDFFRLIRAARPPVVMGEQVAGAPGYGWFDGVASDLESEGYASRSVDIPACAVDAPQIRQRQWWIGVASAEHSGCEGRNQEGHWPSSIDAPTSGHGCMDNSIGDRPHSPVKSLCSGWQSSHVPDGRNGSAWAGAEWIICHDGKARRTEPGLRLLVDGMAGRIPAWRLGGNSISPILAAEVIAAFLDIEQDMGVFA